MPVTFSGGQPLPPVGSQAYKDAQKGSGSGTYNPSSGTITPGSGYNSPPIPTNPTAAQQAILSSPFYLNGYAPPGTGGVTDLTSYYNSAAFQPSYWGSNLGFDVRNITPTPTVNSPQQNPTVGGINGVNGQMSYFDEIDKLKKQQMKDAQTQALALQTSDKANQEKGLLAKLMGGPTREQTLATASAQSNIAQYQSDISARSAEINTLSEQYNKLTAARDQQVATTQDKFASTNFISNQVAQINRNAAPELNRISADINAKTAMMQVSQGQVQNAQKYITQMVDAVTADKKDMYDMYTQLHTENEQAFQNLRSDYKDAFNAVMSNAKDAWLYSRDQATKVGNLMIENPQAGIDPHDTFDQALEKVQKNPKTTGSTVGSAAEGYSNIVRDSQGNVIRTQPVLPAKNPAGGPVKLSSTQLNQGSSLLGVTSQEFKALDPQVQTFFTAPGGKSFMGALQDIKSGKSTYADVKSGIDSSVQPQQVKDYMQQMLDKTNPQKTGGSSKGIGETLNDWWTGLKNWFSGSDSSNPASTGDQKKNNQVSFSELKTPADVQATKEAAYKAFPFTAQAHQYIDQAKIGILKNKSNAVLIGGSTAEGDTVPKGADFHNFIVKNVLPFSSKASDFILNHTNFLQNLDKANINITTTDPTILGHEMLHQVFANSPLSETNPDLTTNVNAEKFGNQFLDIWDQVAQKNPDAPLQGIDAHINRDYDINNMVGADIATEKFAYLGELVAKYGTNVIPKELRPFYKQVFKFSK